MHLTPDEFEARFGMSDDDLNSITGWLKSHGFTVDEVGKGRRWINFSGNVGQVLAARSTRLWYPAFKINSRTTPMTNSRPYWM